ncbi:ribbon-helix-helix protein, CopG family [Thermodesulfovibrio sp. TK110]
MTEQLIIKVDKKTKRKFARIARMEGKTTSEKLRELIEQYIKERDIEKYIDKLWNRIGVKLKSKSVTPELIEKAIRDHRSESRN